MDLKHIIDTTAYFGVMAVGDIHAEYDLVRAAVKYAEDRSLFVVFLGDLIDGGKYPHETVAFVKSKLDARTATAIIGNHEDKFYRYALGRDVILNKEQLNTLDDVADLAGFLADLQGVVDHELVKHYFHFGNTVFLHGAVHHSVWNRPSMLTGKQKAMALYGEVDGTRDEIGFPVRTYTWVDAIPADHVAVVGHDRVAMGKTTIEAVVRHGASGGKAIFTDTSAGKGVAGGHLTGAIFEFVPKGLEFSSFVSFK